MKAKTLLLPPIASATFLVLLIWTGSAMGATEKVLYNFSAYAQGAHPGANLIADAGGNLYGTTFRGGAYELGAVFKLIPSAHGQWTETFLYSFKGGSDGAYPSSRLVFDSAGNLYGTTSFGGTGSCNSGCGTVFKLAPSSHSGWTESVLYTFQGGSDGQSPNAGLTLDSAGNLYGTTLGGGTGSCSIFVSGCGMVFKLAPNSQGGWAESIVYTFTGGSDGGAPAAELIFDSAGSLYGTASYGGTSTSTGSGTVFKLTPSSNSWTLSVLHSFAGSAGNDGSYPQSGLIFDKAGNLYGTTFAGGSKHFCAAGCGTVFELISNGDGTYSGSVLHSFTGVGDGEFPYAGLVLDQAGNLYGEATSGGNNRPLDGVVFQLVPGSSGQWTENILHVFTGRFDGAYPSAGGALVIDQANNLYGTTSYGGTADAGTVFKLTPTSTGQWTKSTIFLFPGTDGRFPDGNLVEDASGNFYGTTSQGATSGVGEVFKLAPNSSGGWAKSTIYSFQGTPDIFAAGPSNLVFDKSGNLYGTAEIYPGFGLIFELKPNGSGWTESTIYTFSSTNDGSIPVGLVTDSSGNLYGATAYGGTGGGGIIYELTNNGSGVWTKTVLYSFSQTTQTPGDEPMGGLVFDAAGNLYGTTALGGTLKKGVVFELSPSSGGQWTESVLYNFAGGNDGSAPAATLVFDPAGNLYGTTYQGGTANHGTAFTLTHSSAGWTESVLHSFTGGSDGAGYNSMPGLVIDGAGNLYGTTPKGGDATCNCGIVFKLSPGSGGQWTETVLHDFIGYPSDGQGGNPLIMDPTGILYGASPSGGTAGDGTFFEVTP